MSYRIMQEFIAFCYNMSLRIYGVSTNFWVKMISFVITPYVTTAGEFFKQLQSPNTHIFVFVSVTEKSLQYDTP